MRTKVVTILSFFLLSMAGFKSYAQDPHLSQFYAAPLYLSPSFAGGTTGSRIAMNYRSQWLKLPEAFTTYAFSFDHYFPRTNSGIGLMFLKDKAGSGAMSTSISAFQYSYNLMINRNLFIKPGIQFGYIQKSIDVHDLVFNDQLYYGTETSVDVKDRNSLNSVPGYIDFASSVLIYSDRYWFGTKVDHLATPNESFWRTTTSRVPRKVTAYGGAKFGLNGKLGKYNEESISFTFIYRAQKKYDQLDLGAYWLRSSIVVGFWYRGLPVKHNGVNFHNHDAITVLLGYQLKDLKIGYSYDLTVSKLSNNNSGGSHEVSLIFEFNQNQKVRKRRRKVVVACPKF